LEVPTNYGRIPGGAHNFGRIPDSGIRRSLRRCGGMKSTRRALKQEESAISEEKKKGKTNGWAVNAETHLKLHEDRKRAIKALKNVVKTAADAFPFMHAHVSY
jgi:hypothetical protein